MTNAQLVLEKIKSTLCHEGTTYKGNSGTYMFIEGKTTSEGTINGVVKKLDDQDVAKTAGSFKFYNRVKRFFIRFFSQNLFFFSFQCNGICCITVDDYKILTLYLFR